MRELAKLAGVSPGAPFRHFDSREALLVAVAEEGMNRLLRRYEAAAADISDPIERERARGAAHVRFAVEEPGYFRVMHSGEVVRHAERVRKTSVEYVRSMDAVLGKSVGGSVAEALTGRTPETLAAQALVYGLSQMLVEGLFDEPLDGEAAERLAYEITGILGYGKASTRPQAPPGDDAE